VQNSAAPTPRMPERESSELRLDQNGKPQFEG
jgi:hypothetical protein